MDGFKKQLNSATGIPPADPPRAAAQPLGPADSVPDIRSDVPGSTQIERPGSEHGPKMPPAQSAPTKKPKKCLKWMVLGGLVLAIAGAVSVCLIWYQGALRPVQDIPRTNGNWSLACESEQNDMPEKTFVKCDDFVVEDGWSVQGVAAALEKQGLIRSELAFRIYTKLHGAPSGIKAGTHALSPEFAAGDILRRLESEPEASVFRVTFVPGGTLSDAKETLKKAGYPEADIDTAFTKQYEHPALADRAADADLEGYLYGETYEFYQGVPLETIIKTCLDELYKVVQANDLVAKFKAQGLNLHQGVVLASIVQREGGDDLPGVASVFLNRLGAGMTLGSDVTYQYIADKLGLERDPYLDNPYNTRRYPGLPPGQISSPGKNALLAVADPSQTDYLFFLSGDDDKTYFAKTEAEHQRNIREHCQIKCQIV